MEDACDVFMIHWPWPGYNIEAYDFCFQRDKVRRSAREESMEDSFLTAENVLPVLQYSLIFK